MNMVNEKFSHFRFPEFPGVIKFPVYGWPERSSHGSMLLLSMKTTWRSWSKWSTSEFGNLQWHQPVPLSSELVYYQFRPNLTIAMIMARDPFDTMLGFSWLNLGKENRNEKTRSKLFQVPTVLHELRRHQGFLEIQGIELSQCTGIGRIGRIRLPGVNQIEERNNRVHEANAVKCQNWTTRFVPGWCQN
jgi:hypothetical protein